MLVAVFLVWKSDFVQLLVINFQLKLNKQYVETRFEIKNKLKVECVNIKYSFNRSKFYTIFEFSFHVFIWIM